MPIKAEILTEQNLFVMRAMGLADHQVMFDFQSSIKGMPGYTSTLNTLFDLTLIDNNLLSPESLIKFSATTPFKASCHRAYVVNNEMAAILATIFATTTSNDSEHFFVTYKVEDACEWLNVSSDEINALAMYHATE